MWPMCSDPVTLGGGMTSEKTGRPARGGAEDAGIDPPLRPMRLEPLGLVHFSQFAWPHIASLGIEDEGSLGQLGRLGRSHMPAADPVEGRLQHQQLFFEQGDGIQVVGGIGQRDQRQVESAVEQARDHLLGGANHDIDDEVRKLFAQLAQRPAQVVDQSGGAGGEVERMPVVHGVAFEFLLDQVELVDHLARAFGQAPRRGSGRQPLARAHEQLGVELRRQAVELQADRPWSQVDPFRRPRDAGAIEHRQKQL
jgi:hypothetical protein